MNFVEGNSLSAYARFGKMASSKTLGFLREKKEQFRSSFVSERMSRLLDDFDNSSRKEGRKEFMMMGTLNISQTS